MNFGYASNYIKSVTNLITITSKMSNNIGADNVVQLACQEAGCKCVPIASKGLPVSTKLAIDNTMKDGASYVILPVFEIDGLKVSCELIVNENGMSLIIKTTKMLMYDKTPEDRVFLLRQLLFRKTYIKKLTKYTLKDYETVIKHINNDIQVIKFDKLNGVFVTPQIKHPREVPHVRSNLDMLNSVPCHEEHPEECSVCLDTTKTTTPCGHKLCVSCWCQIKLKGRELPCPICRVDLFQSKKIGVKDCGVDDDIAVWNNDGDDDSDSDDENNDLYFWESQDEDEDDDDVEYDEFPSVNQNNIMDMY